MLPQHAEEIRADLLLEEFWQRLAPAAREHAIQVGALRTTAPRFVIDRLGVAAPELIRTGLLSRGSGSTVGSRGPGGEGLSD